ncbi:hypothetical protein NDU88_002229 [Pleurodeles waltl]|uniref:Uncharacterized protein n=1 Tax=Pleurodeles waltl TaxID=8319 RepID=A0AAV7VAM1_PLEWA|nr:hypothetical protein NDU88_002229 [Pleurodeles waltl]
MRDSRWYCDVLLVLLQRIGAWGCGLALPCMLGPSVLWCVAEVALGRSCTMGKDKVGKGTQQTRMDQYTAQTLGGTLPQEPPGPLNKGSEPTGTQILAVIEASSQAVKSQIAAMAVDVNLLRADLRVVAEHWAVWDWLELGDDDSAPRSRSRGTSERPTKMGGVQSTVRRTSRQRHAICSARVVVRSDGTLSMDGRRWEREEARRLEALTGYFGGNRTTAQSRGIEWEALKVNTRGESLTKTYGIWKKLDQELAQQEDALVVLLRQIDNGDALGSESQVVRGCIGSLWSGLDSYVHKDFKQRLHREGDRSGRLLAWLLRRERPIPLILSLWGPTGDRILGQSMGAPQGHIFLSAM